MPGYKRRLKTIGSHTYDPQENWQEINKILASFSARLRTHYTAEICKRDGKRYVLLRWHGVPFFFSDDPVQLHEALKWHREFRRTYKAYSVVGEMQAWDYEPIQSMMPPPEPKKYTHKRGAHLIHLYGWEYRVFYKGELIGSSDDRATAHSTLKEHVRFLADGRAYKRSIRSGQCA